MLEQQNMLQSVANASLNVRKEEVEVLPNLLVVQANQLQA